MNTNPNPILMIPIAGTHPHHKHIPPDIKHHRIPAPEMSFIRPNIPALVGEIESLIRKIESEAEAKRV